MRSQAPSFRRSLRCLPPLLLPALLLAVLALAACSSAPPRVYTPLRYDYLLPLRLNVASLTIESRFVPAGANDLNALDPSPLVPTLTQMARDRLQAVGSSGHAVFVIKDATLARTGDGIRGSLDVELDVYGGEGTRAGFAEARVSRTRTDDLGDMRSALYDMTKQLMDAMNIEFEYQVRRSLHDWLVSTSAVPAPVQQQALPPPPGAKTAPESLAPTSLAPASLAPASLAPLAPMPTYPAPAPGLPPSSMSPYSPPPSSLPPPQPYPTLAPNQVLKLPPTVLAPPQQP
jgi:hypothetical protein